jgi:curved DNA-binding protein CbpA
MSHYATLGVPRDASATEIKAAFRKLASEHHPDRGGDTDKAAAVNDAYACLSDSERRARYDASGEDRQAGPTAEEARRAEVQSTLMKAIDESLGHDQVESRGLIAVARGRLDGALQQQKKQEAMIADARGLLERLLKRLRRKAAATGDDLVQMIITGKLADLQRALDAAKHAGGILSEARSLLDVYEEDSETPVPKSEAMKHIEAGIFSRFGRS